MDYPDHLLMPFLDVLATWSICEPNGKVLYSAACLKAALDEATYHEMFQGELTVRLDDLVVLPDQMKRIKAASDARGNREQNGF